MSTDDRRTGRYAVLTHTEVLNGPVSIPVTRSGTGPQVVFFNGVGATRIAWKRVIARLANAYESITFDFRGHGRTSRSDTYSVNGFLTDAEAVMAAVGPSRPIIVGWSAGADLAVEYASTHPKAVAGLVLVDGAVPISEPLVEDGEQMRRSLNSIGVRLGMRLMRPTPYGYAIPPNAIADLTIEVDQRRQRLLENYQDIKCPITMILATNTSRGDGPHARHVNRAWRDGAARLREAHPEITVQWIDGSHKLPFSHPADIAHAITNLA
jgi:esterase